MGYEFRESKDKDKFYIVSNFLFVNETCYYCFVKASNLNKCKSIHKKSHHKEWFYMCNDCKDLKTDKVTFEIVMNHDVIHFISFLNL